MAAAYPSQSGGERTMAEQDRPRAPWEPMPAIPPPPPDLPPTSFPRPPVGVAGGYAGSPSYPQYTPPSVWRPLRGLTTALTVLFWCSLASAAFLVGALANRISVIGDIQAGSFDLDTARRSDDLVTASAAIFGLLTIAIVVLFIIWMYRAAKNNEALGRMHPRFSPGWSIGAWFIPLANLVIPVLIMQDLWRGSDPRLPRGDAGWRLAPGSGLVAWWWAALLASLTRYYSSSSDARSATRSLSDVKRHDSIVLFGAAMAGVAAVLALVMVRRLAARQEECLRAQQDAWQRAGSWTPQ